MGIKELSDPDAWVDEHGDALFRYALVRVRDPDVAEDLVQEAFLAALESRDSFRGDSAERTWLIGILRHKIMDRLRLSTQQQALGADDAEDTRVDGWFGQNGRWVARPHSWKLDPARLVEDREFWQVFEGCMEALPQRVGEAFALRVLSEIDSLEVCKVLEITSTNLWVMLHRARARLRACLEAKWFTGS